MKEMYHNDRSRIDVPKLSELTLGDKWNEYSYRLALRLYERGDWPIYMSPSELPHLALALESQEAWVKFISPTHEIWNISAKIGNERRMVNASGNGGQVQDHDMMMGKQHLVASGGDNRLSHNSKPGSVSSSVSSLNGARPHSNILLGGSSSRQDSPVAGGSSIQKFAGGKSEHGEQRPGKRIKIEVSGDGFGTDEDDDEMLSVLSGSDVIDMGMWGGGEGSINSNVMSPSSNSENLHGSGHATGIQHGFVVNCNFGDIESSVVSALAAFHARSAIFEQCVSVLYGPHDCALCSSDVGNCTDIRDIVNTMCSKSENQEKKTDETHNISDGKTRESSTTDRTINFTDVKSRKLDEDEDYDDDDEEEEEEDEGKEGKEKTENDKIQIHIKKEIDETDTVRIKQELADKDHSDMASGANDSTLVKLEQGPCGDDKAEGETQNGYKFDLDREMQAPTQAVFRTLEDMERAVDEQHKHEDDIRALKEVMEQRSQEPKDMLVNQIGSLYHMKNLAQFIDDHRDSVSMTTRELTHLLSEVRPKRSKWANERRIGQEQLYNALEHVLHELKTMGPAAQPFLTQVKRRDAPDYYEVIPNPMDLGAMSKKLRGLHYVSKDEFAHDLQLIRDNCYMYNTEPGNMYRKNADALIRRSKQLMSSVPNIVVRDRDEVESQGVHNDDGNNTEFGDESGDESQGAKTIYGNREESAVAEDSTPNLGMIDGSTTGSQFGTHIQGNNGVDIHGNGARYGEQQAASSRLALNIQRAVREGSILQSAMAELVEGVEQPLGERIWRMRARRSLARYEQGAKAEQGEEFGERRAVVRTGEAMRMFLDSTHNGFEDMKREEMDELGQPLDMCELLTMYSQSYGMSAAGRKRNEQLDEKRKESVARLERLDERGWRFVAESQVASGLPQTEPAEWQGRKGGVERWLEEDEYSTTGDENKKVEADAETLERPEVEAYEAGRFPSNRMWRVMADNIEQLKQIREIDGKIWAAKLNIPVGYLNAASSGSGGSKKEGESQTLYEIHGDYARRGDPAEKMNVDSVVGRSLLKRTVAVILEHSGFEAITSSALACVVELIIDYMSNLGRTLRTYCDKYGNAMSAEAVLSHSLYENGCDDLAELEYFLRGEADKYGAKLSDIHRKLTRSYRDVVSEGARPEGTADASLENESSFMTGMLGGFQDLGEDFFGFKELGLDKELGLETINVPQRLWFGKTADGGEQFVQNGEGDADDSENAETEAWAPIVTVNGQIGLMHEFLGRKLRDKNGADEAAKGERMERMPEKWQPIVEDERMPAKSRFGASRPKQPPPNCLTHPTTHSHVGSGKPVASKGRAAKKKPSGGSKSTRKS